MVVSPPLSVTEAVIVWVPRPSTAETLAPVPRAPFMLEVQTISALRLPSSASLAEPVKVIDVPESNVAPFDGLEIETEGGLLVGGVPPPRASSAALACTKP